MALRLSGSVLHQKQPAQQDQAGDYGCVGNVENRPRPHVDKIGDVAQSEPVQQVPRRTAQLQADAQPQQGTLARLAMEDQQQHGDAHERGKDQREILVLKKPKCAARVVGVGEA